MRRRYHQLFREEIAQMVASPDEVEEELRNLCAVLSSVSPDGRRLAVGFDGLINILDLASRQILVAFEDSLSLSPKFSCV